MSVVVRRAVVVMGLSLFSEGLGSQASPDGWLSGALRTHLTGERFQIVTSIRGLPLGVRDALQTLFGSPTLDIVEPGAAFDAGRSPTPVRRLVAASCSMDHCLVYYERGGAAHTWHAALFHWRPAATRLEGGGEAPSGLASPDDVMQALLAGRIRRPSSPW